MSKLVRISGLFLALIFSVSATAWQAGTASIDQIWTWQTGSNGSDKIYFKLSDGEMCFIEDSESILYSLILSLNATGKTVNYHCWDDEVTTQGIAGHKVHRLVSNK